MKRESGEREWYKERHERGRKHPVGAVCRGQGGQGCLAMGLRLPFSLGVTPQECPCSGLRVHMPESCMWICRSEALGAGPQSHSDVDSALQQPSWLDSYIISFTVGI